MPGRAEPLKCLWPIRQSSPDRIALHITQSIPQVPPLQRVGIEPVLPKMAAPSLPGTKIMSVSAMSSSQSRRQSGFFLRYRNQADVLRHLAINEYADSRLTAILSLQLQVNFAIGLAEEAGLSISPQLRNVMRDSKDYDSCCSRNLTLVVGSSD